MDGKKIAVYVVLLAVVVGAVVIAVTRVSGRGGPPNWVMDQREQKIDRKTLELVTESRGDWLSKYAPDSFGRFKNPKTGTYTMVDPIKCVSCGEMIPGPDYSAVKMIPDDRPLPPGVDASKMQRKMVADPMDSQRIRQEYKCPKCGKSPFSF